MTRVISGDSGMDLFRTHADLILFGENQEDNYMEIVDFDSTIDILILPFLSTDSVAITLEGTSVYATLETGLKDKLIFESSFKRCVYGGSLQCYGNGIS